MGRRTSTPKIKWLAYTWWPKNGSFCWTPLTLSNINRFSKFFHRQKLRIRRKFVITLSLENRSYHTSSVSRLPSLQLGCFYSNSTHSALEILHFMRYIYSRLTYLLTYLVSETIKAHGGRITCASFAHHGITYFLTMSTYTVFRKKTPAHILFHISMNDV